MCMYIYIYTCSFLGYTIWEMLPKVRDPTSQQFHAALQGRDFVEVGPSFVLAIIDQSMFCIPILCGIEEEVASLQTPFDLFWEIQFQSIFGFVQKYGTQNPKVYHHDPSFQVPFRVWVPSTVHQSQTQRLKLNNRWCSEPGISAISKNHSPHLAKMILTSIYGFIFRCQSPQGLGFAIFASQCPNFFCQTGSNLHNLHGSADVGILKFQSWRVPFNG